MPLIGDPPNNLAVVSLIRAAIADDAESGIFIMSEHGGCQPGAEGKEAAQFMMPWQLCPPGRCCRPTGTTWNAP